MENIQYTLMDGTWYDEACNVLRLKHYLHSSLEKSLMEESINTSKIESRV